jgi:hypothetical protein
VRGRVGVNNNRLDRIEVEAVSEFRMNGRRREEVWQRREEVLTSKQQ